MSNEWEGARVSGRNMLRAEEGHEYGRSASRARTRKDEPEEVGGAQPDGRESAKKRRRFTAIWFVKKSIVPLLWILGLFAGMYIGYVYLGKGQASDVFQVSTWRHMYDLIFSDS